jgi:hypothetical protein
MKLLGMWKSGWAYSGKSWRSDQAPVLSQDAHNVAFDQPALLGRTKNSLDKLLKPSAAQSRAHLKVLHLSLLFKHQNRRLC